MSPASRCISFACVRVHAFVNACLRVHLRLRVHLFNICLRACAQMNTRARPQDGEEAREKESDALEAQRQRLTDELDTQTKDLTGSKYVDDT